MTPKRKSIVIDGETKDVFDWSINEELNRNSSEHIRKLLETYHKKEWSELLTDTRICEEHGKPYTLMCKDCKDALCPECKIDLHKGHEVQFYCRIHQMGYQTACVLCECDRWSKIVDVDMISADKLNEELGSDDIICVDVRGKKERAEGYLPKSYHFKGANFRPQTTDESKTLKEFIEENRDKRWIFISQGYINDPKLTKYGRAWLAAADLKTMYQIEDVSCLEGGWVCFHREFPDIVEGHKSNGSCQICESRRL